jgi:imidazolonepropionase-like amidohydrolase
MRIASRTMLRGSLAAIVLSSAALAQESTRAIRGAALVAPDGSIQKGGLVVVREGTIDQIGGDAPGGVPIDEFERAVVCPGLIDVLGSLSAVGNETEALETIQPGLRGIDALNRFHPHLRSALSAGVTAFALAPDDQNVISGRYAVCLTESVLRDSIRTITESGPLKLSLSSAAFVPDREPTSRSGSIAALRSALSGAREAKPPSAGPLADFVGGKIRGVAIAPEAADALTFLQLAAEYNLRLAIAHTHDAREIAAELARGGAPAIVGPLDFDSSQRDATAPAIYEAAKVPVAIAGGLPFHSADGLRIGAAVAARNGFSSNAARRSITATAADALGVADKIGSIQKGRRGDLVVFSGDPLDLRSRVLAVYSGGRRVYSAPQE